VQQIESASALEAQPLGIPKAQAIALAPPDASFMVCFLVGLALIVAQLALKLGYNSVGRFMVELPLLTSANACT